jgi:hypothetical protein
MGRKLWCHVMPDRWQHDSAFVDWMRSMGYIITTTESGAVLKHYFTGDGIVLYMYEAWCAALKMQNDKRLSDLPFQKPRKGATRG